MKREGVSTLSIHDFPWALSYSLDHLPLFECTCGVGFESILKKCLCNGSRLYKNVYKVLFQKNSSKRCLCIVFFEGDFEKIFL